MALLRRNIKYCSEDCKKTAYLALVRSVLNYGAIVLDPYVKSDIFKLERVQRQTARFITGDYKSRNQGCVTDMLTKLKVPL